MILEESGLVVRTTAASGLQPSVAVTIAVDTAYVAAQGSGGTISSGVYMMDNMVAGGSTGEGTLDLHTKCNNGDLIGYHCVPINALGSSGDQVVITAFLVDGTVDVFTGAGMPEQQPALAGEPDGTYWIGQAMAQGTQEYSIQIKLMVGELHPVAYYVNWDAHLTSS